MGLSDCSQEVMWVRNIFLELGYKFHSVPICSNNQGALFVSENSVICQGVGTERMEIGVRVRVRAGNTLEYGDIRGQSIIEKHNRRQLDSAYEGLHLFGAAFAWISEQDRGDSEDESEV